MSKLSGTASPEGYWQGVRRRVRSAVVVAGIYCLCGLLCYAVYISSRSALLTLATGIVAGAGGQWVDVRVDPIRGWPAISKSDKVVWVALLSPAIIGLTAVLIYFANRPPQGVVWIGATGVALLLGAVLAATHAMLTAKAN